jgi:hypothetical protein
MLKLLLICSLGATLFGEGFNVYGVHGLLC